jgi:hypothetical protein
MRKAAAGRWPMIEALVGSHGRDRYLLMYAIARPTVLPVMR